jgi:hypothetical protein
MLTIPNPEHNGITLSHSELRKLHEVMRAAIREATARYCVDGPRLLRFDRGETYRFRAHSRDREGNLLASVTIYLPEHGQRYTRRVRLLRWQHTQAKPYV